MPTRSITLSTASVDRLTSLLQWANDDSPDKRIFADGVLRSLIERRDCLTSDGVALALASHRQCTVRSMNLPETQLWRLDRMTAALAPGMPGGRPSRSRTVGALIATAYLREYQTRPVPDKGDGSLVAKLYRDAQDPVKRAEWESAHARKVLAEQEAKRIKRREQQRRYRAR